MAYSLPSLQDAHNRRLSFIVAVRGDALVCLLVLFLGLLELHCVDLDAVFRVSEVGVERESIGGVNLSAFGMFGQWSDLGAGKRLEGPIEFRRSCELLVGETFQLLIELTKTRSFL